MQEQWRIRVRGKQRQEVNLDLLVAAIIALGKQLAAEAKAQQAAVSPDPTSEEQP